MILKVLTITIIKSKFLKFFNQFDELSKILNIIIMNSKIRILLLKIKIFYYNYN